MSPVELVFNVIGCLIIFGAGVAFLHAWFAQRRMRQSGKRQELGEALFRQEENE